MFLFFGDSHSRQFQADNPGNWGHVSFTGATIKGLGSDLSATKHGPIIRSLSQAPFSKTILLMFGSVDLDVTFYRNIVLGKGLTEEEFFEERARVYRGYVDKILWASEPFLRRICILAPQVTPLADPFFLPATARMAKLERAEFRSVLEQIDCSHVERCRRQIRFNDVLARHFSGNNRIRLYRIDRKMVDKDLLIRPNFIRPNPRDHHARMNQTLPLWQKQLANVVPLYKRLCDAREQAGKNAPQAAASNATSRGNGLFHDTGGGASTTIM